MVDEKLEKVDKLKEIAKEIGATLPQLAIAWVAKNDNVSVVLMGATKEAQVRWTSSSKVVDCKTAYMNPMLPLTCTCMLSPSLTKCRQLPPHIKEQALLTAVFKSASHIGVIESLLVH